MPLRPSQLPIFLGAAMQSLIIDDRQTWNSWAIDWEMASILQSYEWGEFKALSGWQPVRLAVEDRDNIVAGVQLLIRRLPLGTIAYAPRGPSLTNATREVRLFLLDEMHRVARQHGASFLKIEPEVSTTSDFARTLQTTGFITGDQVQPRSTITLDLSADLDTLLNGINAKTRYNIRVATRKGLTIREGGIEDVDDFYRLLLETSTRSGFSVHKEDYYRFACEMLRERGMARLLLAKHNDKLLAAAMVFLAGKRAYYMYSASSSEMRNLKPNELLQWECIKLAKSQGCLLYDFWGIPDEIGAAVEIGANLDQLEESEGHNCETGARTMWGVYHFKRGFGGRVVRYAGAYDYVYSSARYKLYLAGLLQARSLLKVGRWAKVQVG
jgi:lipid II:glycine glycyltransferase (peptidoglycan interpeptide bridge formation enzyme)